MRIISHNKINKNIIIPYKPLIRYSKEIYTDASLQKKNMGVGIWNYQNDIELSLKLKGLPDINRGELGAILIALLTYKKNLSDISILTDSLTSLDVIRDINKCNKFYILKKCIQFLIKNNNVNFIKVKAHSGIIGNENADYLADYGVKNESVGIFTLPDDICSNDSFDNIDIVDIIYTVKSINKL